MAKPRPSPFYKPSKDRGVVPCSEWGYFVIHELKTATVRLLGPPVRTPQGRYAIHCIDRSNGAFKIVEGPHELFEQFALYAKYVSNGPSGAESPDFTITLITRPFGYRIIPLSITRLSEKEQFDMVCHALDLGKIYGLEKPFHILQMSTRLGVWPKPFWPTKHQEKCNASNPERLAAEGVIIRFPSRDELGRE